MGIQAMAMLIPPPLAKGFSVFVKGDCLRERGFLRNVLVVMSGTGLAQIFSIFVAPLLSRLYGPVDFGLYGSFVSVAGILSAAVTLQYSEALMLPDSDAVAARLFVAACVVAAVFTLLFGAFFIIFPGFWLRALRAPELRGWLWLIPLAALVTGLNQTLTAWCARRKAFKHSAVAQVVRSMGAGCGQTCAGLARCGGGGLIAGGLAGDVLVALSLWRWALRDGGLLRSGLRATDVGAAARQYKDFPLYSAPQNLLNAASNGVPVILLSYYYGLAIGGIYAFSVRVLQVPMSFVLTSLRQVLFQKLSELHNARGQLEEFFSKCTTALFMAALLPAAVGFVFAPQIFAFVFGAKWLIAGEYARWLLLWFLPGFCNVPAVLLGRILRLQRNLLCFDAALLISRVAALVLGGIYLSPVQTIAVFSVVGATFNIVLIAYVWWRLKARV